MPSSTPKQARTMAAAAHDPAFAKKVGIPQKVAKDFNQADKGTGIRKKQDPEEQGETTPDNEEAEGENASQDPALAAARRAITKAPKAATPRSSKR